MCAVAKLRKQVPVIPLNKGKPGVLGVHSDQFPTDANCDYFRVGKFWIQYVAPFANCIRSILGIQVIENNINVTIKSSKVAIIVVWLSWNFSIIMLNLCRIRTVIFWGKTVNYRKILNGLRVRYITSRHMCLQEEAGFSFGGDIPWKQEAVLATRHYRCGKQAAPEPGTGGIQQYI